MSNREDHKFRIETRERLYEEQQGKCFYCGRSIIGKPSLDHIIPIEEHEPYAKDNYVVTCIKCNKVKLSYIVFTNLEDRLIYPIIDIPYFFRASYIQTNRSKK